MGELQSWSAWDGPGGEVRLTARTPTYLSVELFRGGDFVGGGGIESRQVTVIESLDPERVTRAERWFPCHLYGDAVRLVRLGFQEVAGYGSVREAAEQYARVLGHLADAADGGGDGLE